VAVVAFCCIGRAGDEQGERQGEQCAASEGHDVSIGGESVSPPPPRHKAPCQGKRKYRRFRLAVKAYPQNATG
jgi:hypothetical protein